MSKSVNVRLMIILFILFLIGVNQFVLNDNYNHQDHQIKLKNQILKDSGYWELEPIQIDGIAKGPGANNWTWAQAQDWCSGLGTLNSPYIIENITIDGLSAESCIIIENSDVYFIIKNCTLTNSGTGFADAGVHFNNVTNGKIDNNIFLSPIVKGISLLYSQNIQILHNYINLNYDDEFGIDSSYNGIYIKESHNITFYQNEITKCVRGLYFDNEFSFDIRILQNNISFNVGSGVYLVGNGSGKEIIISDNRFFNNSFALSIYKCNQCEISNNLIYDNSQGMSIDYMKNSTILGNNFDNLEHNPALFLQHFINNTVCNNNIRNCHSGLAFYFDSYKNIIKNNTVFNCIGNGITVSSAFNSLGDYNKISENIIINNGYAGIYISTNNNSIVNNTIKFHQYGIYLSDGQHNNISRNLIHFSTDYGIKFDSAHQNTIRNNTLYDNKYGLILESSNNNSITGNSFTKNYECIILQNSYDNIIKYNYCETIPTIIPITIFGYNVFIVLCLILIINTLIRIKSKVIK